MIITCLLFLSFHFSKINSSGEFYLFADVFLNLNPSSWNYYLKFKDPSKTISASLLTDFLYRLTYTNGTNEDFYKSNGTLSTTDTIMNGTNTIQFAIGLESNMRSISLTYITYNGFNYHFDNTIFMVTNEFSVLSFSHTQFTKQGDNVRLKFEKKEILF